MSGKAIRAVSFPTTSFPRFPLSSVLALLQLFLPLAVGCAVKDFNRYSRRFITPLSSLLDDPARPMKRALACVGIIRESAREVKGKDMDGLRWKLHSNFQPSKC